MTFFSHWPCVSFFLASAVSKINKTTSCVVNAFVDATQNTFIDNTPYDSSYYVVTAVDIYGFESDLMVGLDFFISGFSPLIIIARLSGVT